MKYTTFDLDWNRLNYVKDSFSPMTIPRKPANLHLMNDIAKELCKGFEFIRIDLYDLGDRVVFGEMTFTPNSGIAEFFTDDAIKIMGERILNR